MCYFECIIFSEILNAPQSSTQHTMDRVPFSHDTSASEYSVFRFRFRCTTMPARLSLSLFVLTVWLWMNAILNAKFVFISIQADSFEMPTIPEFMFHFGSPFAFLLAESNRTLIPIGLFRIDRNLNDSFVSASGQSKLDNYTFTWESETEPITQYNRLMICALIELANKQFSLL